MSGLCPLGEKQEPLWCEASEACVCKLRCAARILRPFPLIFDRRSSLHSCPCASPCSSRLGRGRLFLAILLTARADYIAPQSLLAAWDVGRRLAEHMNQLPAGSVARLLAALPDTQQPEQAPAAPLQSLLAEQEEEEEQQQHDGQQQRQRRRRHATSQPTSQAEPGVRHTPGQAESSSSQRALGALLLYSYAACADLQREAYHAVRAAARAAHMLEEPAVCAALAAQLAALESAGLELPGRQPLLTAEQLRCACWVRVAERGAQLLSKHRQPGALLITGTTRPRLSPAQQAELEAQLAHAVKSLLGLDPGSARCLMAAAGALAALGHRRQAALLHLRAFQQAAAQQSQYWQLRAAAAVAVDGCKRVSGGGGGSSSGVLPAALAVLEQANGMLSCLELVLPDSWVQRVRSDVSAGRRRVATTRAQAQLIQAFAEDRGGSAQRTGASLAPAAAASAAAGAAGQPSMRRHAAQPSGAPAASIALRKQAAARLASRAFGSEDDLAAVSTTGATLRAPATAALAPPRELDQHAG